MEINEIIVTLLQEVETNPQKNVEQILIEKAREFNLSEDMLSTLAESFKIIDRISEKRKELVSFRAQGGTRDAFIANSVKTISDKLSDEQVAVLANAIEDTTNHLTKEN